MSLWQKIRRWLTLADAPTATDYGPACDRCGRPASVFICINNNKSQWCAEHRPQSPWLIGF